MIEGVRGQAHATVRTERAGEAALLVLERAADDGRDVLVAQRFQPPDAHPRQERRVDLEVRVLGRGADQGDRAVLDVGEEGVLLGLVEPMDLVEEEHGSRAVQGDAVLRLGDQRADVGDTGHDRGDRREMRADLAGQQSSEARLAGSGRTPQQEAGEMTARDAAPKGTRVRRRGAPGRRTHRGSAAASGRPAAARRLAVGTAFGASRRLPWDGWSACGQSRCDRRPCSGSQCRR